MDKASQDIMRALAEPFPEQDVEWKPQHVKGDRCLAVPYITARDVMERLDKVFADGWNDEYKVITDGTGQSPGVICILMVSINGRLVTRSDVGSLSEQPDAGDRLKAAFSDALKRAAVKFGIGRYLYRLEHFWVDYDAKAKKIVKPPKLPAFAVPTNRVRLVSHEEALELKNLLGANKDIDPARFLEKYQVQRLTELPLDHYKDAVSTLKSPPKTMLRERQPAA